MARRSNRSRRQPPASPPPPPAVEPAWAVRRWGWVRCAVVALAAATAAGFWGFAADQVVAEQGLFWSLVGIGIGIAGLVSATRTVAVPAEEIALPGARGWLRPAEAVALRTLGDAGWLVLVVLLGMLVRTAVHVAGGGWSAPLLQSLLNAPLAAFIVFLSLVIVGWLVILSVRAVRGLRSRRRAGEDVPASAWWKVALAVAVALTVPATIAVGLSDTTSAPVEDGDAFVTFLVGDVRLAHAWQYVALWIARLGTLAAAVSVVGLVVARMRERPRA